MVNAILNFLYFFALEYLSETKFIFQLNVILSFKNCACKHQDKRDDFVKNEVTLDYNAGFQSAVAGLRDLQAKGLLPDS